MNNICMGIQSRNLLIQSKIQSISLQAKLWNSIHNFHITESAVGALVCDQDIVSTFTYILNYEESTSVLFRRK